MIKCFFVSSLLVLSPLLHAEVPPAPSESMTETVGQASHDGASQAKKVSWQKISLIAGLFVIATVTIILATNHSGK